MRKQCVGILLALAMLIPTLAACGNTVPEETEPDTDVQETAGGDEISDTVDLVTDGISHYVIVLGENASDMETKAAEELQSYLKQISGAELPIVTDSTAPVIKEIVIGQTNREADGQFAREELANDGFIIQTDAGKLWLIGGNEYGTLYAVYELLESYLGCRFYTAEFEKVPETKTISLQIEEDKQIPVFETRYLLWYDVMQSPDFQLKLKNRTYSWAGGMCHTLPELAETGLGMSDDPCLLKPKTYGTVLKNVRAMLDSAPDAKYISISQSDWQRCNCNDCIASAEEHGWSGHYLMFVNRIAEEIKDEYPTVTIHTFAYQDTVEPPKTDIVPADNVMVQLCTQWACLSHPLTECHREVEIFKEDDDGTPQGHEAWLTEWSEICDYIAIWDYTTSFAGYNIPFPNFDVLRENMRFFADNNVKYVMEQGNYQCTSGEFCELKSYLMARLLWDPYMSEEEYYAHMDDFLEGYYGSGWQYIREYIDYSIEYAEKMHMDNGSLMREFCPPTEDTSNENREIPVLTVEQLRNYAEVDWTQYYEWFVTVIDNSLIAKGLEAFAKARELADNDILWSHVDKSAIQVDFVYGSTTHYMRCQNAESAVKKIFNTNVDNAVTAGEMDAEEAAALKNSFNTDILKSISQEGKKFRNEIYDRKAKYNITQDRE